VQAAGAAALIPTSLALLLAATPPDKRVRAWAAVGGVSAALGPVAGGLLVQLDWRWVFLVNLPIGRPRWWPGPGCCRIPGPGQ